MKKTKKNNKGFSLVELIVVVLIMAIIAVALAPQVMKWVGNSSKSADVQTYDAVVEYCNLALADQATWAKVKTATIIVTIDTDGTETDNTDFEAGLSKVAADWAKSKVSSGSYTITITNGNVARSSTPDPSMD